MIKPFRSLPIILGSLFCFSLPTYAMDQNEFHESLKQLKKSQKENDQRLKHFGVKSMPNHSTNPLSPLDETASDGAEKKAPRLLYVVHDNGKLLRAEPGKLLFGKILNRLIVGGETSPVSSELENKQGLFSGLRALGRARPSGTEGRMAIEFDRIVTRRGTVIPIKGSGQDEAGAFGLEAQLFSSKALAMAGSMVGSFISGVAASQQSQSTNTFGFSQIDRTSRNSLLQGVAQTTADQSKRLIEDATKEKSVLVVEAGTPVTIYLDEEVRF